MTNPATVGVGGLTDRMQGLVGALREVVGRGQPPARTAGLVAETFLPHLGTADLLTEGQRVGDPDHYRQHLLHAEPDGSFSVVALVWLPGQGTSVHDHLAWCATGVHVGVETERRYRLVPDGRTARLVAAEELVNGPGAVCGFAPPGDIHQVCNSGTVTAISLHAYGADIARLGSSVRRVYQLAADER